VSSAQGGRSRPEPLPVTTVVAGRAAWKEPGLWRGRPLWLEQRPHERGRTTLMLRLRPDAPTLELTPGDWNLRSRIHGYGGGVWCLAGDTLVFVDDGDRGLWRLDLPADPEAGDLPVPRRLLPPAPPERERTLADGLIDRRRDRWIGVREQDGRDQLVAVPLSGGEPETLWEPADFCGYAALSPAGSHLAWVEWQQPHMPWQRSTLWLGRFDGRGSLIEARPLAGAAAGAGAGKGLDISVFQPLWAGPDLVLANDRSGWWNLERLADAERLEAGAEPLWEALLPMEAEFGLPQWVYGMRTIAWEGRQLLALACRQGRWQLGRVAAGSGGSWQPFALPFDDLEAVVATEGRLLAIAASPRQASGLLELDTTSGLWHHTPAAPSPLAEAEIVEPEALWFAGHGGLPTHAWLYPARGGDGPATPLLIRAHSGPTGMARTGFNPAIQFWTSRGWSVVDVNYGGSTGFGRAYRERLDGGWGVVDVADCAAAARSLVAAGRADGDRVAMEGGSAAGFTVLALLCFETVLRAGACRYPVTDLSALASSDHRFEARYFDSLVGPWPAARDTYAARSPLQHADRIKAPVILFHGLDDRVVPAEQSERLALAVGERNVPVELHLFPGEGHGFRDSQVQHRVLEATEHFFRQRLALGGVD
jgi:dipeptidyl aminopeptidase/acylaminoacyl peptidase